MSETSCEQVVNPNRQVSDPRSGSMKYGIRNRPGDAHGRYLAHALRAQGIDLWIGLVE